MSTVTETSDTQLLDLIRRDGPLSIAQMAAATEVTANAVRQRLTRLMGQGLVKREVERQGRGRPMHRYSATDKARQNAGSNYHDLALVLWNEIRAVKDAAVRQGLLSRLAKQMARIYDGRVQGDSTAERMRSIQGLLAERNVEFRVEGTNQFPILTAVDCPYPRLAEEDRGICAVEKLMISELLSHKVTLSQCRLDGASCCQFEAN